MRIDIMTDIVTLGRTADATIFQIAAITFDITNGQEYEHFNMIADIEKNKNLNVSGSTLKWLLNIDKELLAKLINAGTESSESVICKFHDWISAQKIPGNEVYLWGNGILFDNKMLQYQMNRIGLEYPIFYRNDRDMQTIIELACHKLGIDETAFKEQNKNHELTAHNAYDDVRWQIALVCKAYNVLMGKDGD